MWSVIQTNEQDINKSYRIKRMRRPVFLLTQISEAAINVLGEVSWIKYEKVTRHWEWKSQCTPTSPPTPFSPSGCISQLCASESLFFLHCRGVPSPSPASTPTSTPLLCFNFSPRRKKSALRCSSCMCQERGKKTNREIAGEKKQ